MESRRKIFYGWYVIIVMWMAYFLCTTPVSYGANVIMLHMVQDGVIRETSIGYASSFRFAVTAVGSVLVSMLIRKKGLRFTILFGTAIMIIGQFMNYYIPLSDGIYILIFGAFGLGMVSSGVLTGPSVVNAWFDRNKALPMSLVISAGAIGGFIFPVVTDWMIQRWNWKICWFVYAWLTVIAFVVVWAVMKDSPEEVGECKDGRRWTECHPARTDLSVDTGERKKVTFKDIVKKPQFYGMAFLSFMNRAFFAGFTCYLLLYAVENGLSSSQGALALSMYNIAGLAGRLLAGASDQIPAPKYIINAASYFPLVIGAAFLVIHPGIGTFYLGAACFGFGVGFAFTLYPLLVSEYFGSGEFSLLFGIYNAVAGIGSTITPLVLQVFAGMLGSYRIVYMAMGVLPLICVGLSLMMPTGKRGYTAK